MYLVQRIRRFIYGFVASYGPSNIKKLLWDREFSRGNWDFLDNTAGDCVYQHLERYATNGSILDLGCGPGNTANELAATAYWTYLGVDIADSALSKARRRTEESGRADKNTFVQGDFLNYVPTRQFDVILFRESMYHVPLGKVKAILDRYSKYLRDGGVFIVRMYTSQNGKSKHRPKAMIGVIETEFDVVEKAEYEERGATVIAFRPRACRKSGGTSSKTAAQPA
jgi:SAM-dependent methyltransferase